MTSPDERQPVTAVWIVARKSDGEAMAVYANEADANEDVSIRHRSHRDRYKVEAWQVLGVAEATSAASGDALREALERLVDAVEVYERPRHSDAFTEAFRLVRQCVACDNTLINGQCPIHGDLSQAAATPPLPEGLDVERLAEALKVEGFVRGVAARYGNFNDVYWQQSAEVLIARLQQPASREGA